MATGGLAGETWWFCMGDVPPVLGSFFGSHASPSWPCPTEHEVLLECVRRWPQGAYDVAQLQAAALE